MPRFSTRRSRLVYVRGLLANPDRSDADVGQAEVILTDELRRIEAGEQRRDLVVSRIAILGAPVLRLLVPLWNATVLTLLAVLTTICAVAIAVVRKLVGDAPDRQDESER